MQFQPELETMPRERRAEEAGRRLRGLVERLRKAEAPYWRDKLADTGAVASIDELAQLPFTTKPEMRTHYPLGMLAVPAADTVRIHASSGTKGKPTIVAYTRADVDVFADVNARAIACAGGGPADVLQVAYGYGLFTGGLGLHYGGERLGATVIPASGGNTPLQLQLLVDLGAAGLCATPSFATLLAERAQAAGIGGLALRYGVFGAEPWSEAMRAKLEAAWAGLNADGTFDACDIYGLSEVIGPGVACECRESKGALHVFDDHFWPEIVDPTTGEAADHGELVLTTLTKEALPVLRYRTGDLTRWRDEACPCGRTHRRIGRFTGRVDDMLVVRGVNIYPSEVEAVVLDDPALSGQYALVVDRRGAMPELEIRAELAEPLEPAAAEEVTRRVAQRMLDRLRLRVLVDIGPPGSIPRQEVGKAKRVFDRTSDADPLTG